MPASIGACLLKDISGPSCDWARADAGGHLRLYSPRIRAPGIVLVHVRGRERRGLAVVGAERGRQRGVGGAVAAIRGIDRATATREAGVRVRVRRPAGGHLATDRGALAEPEAGLPARQVLGWPKRCQQLAHALLWEHSYKGRKLAQLSLGRRCTRRCRWRSCSPSRPCRWGRTQSGFASST